MKSEIPAAPAYRARLYGDYLTNSGSSRPRVSEAYYRSGARVARAHFRKLLPEDQSARILDLGCGHGAMLYALKSMGYTNLLGVDCSEEQLGLARKVHPEVKRMGAIEFLSTNQERFQVIIARDLLEHFDKDEALLLMDRCRAALTSGGRILLQLPNSDCLRGLQNATQDFGHEVFYSPRSLEQLLGIAGFEEVRVFPAGPVPHGLLSTARWLLWKGIDSITRLYDLVEMGRPGSGVHTRVMLAVGARGPRRVSTPTKGDR